MQLLMLQQIKYMSSADSGNIQHPNVVITVRANVLAPDCARSLSTGINQSSTCQSCSFCHKGFSMFFDGAHIIHNGRRVHITWEFVPLLTHVYIICDCWCTIPISVIKKCPEQQKCSRYLCFRNVTMQGCFVVTHICVSKLTIIGSDNGLSPERRQAIICTNAGILSIRILGTNFSEILSEIPAISFKKMHLKMSSAQ